MGSIYLNNIRYGGLSGPPEGDQVYVDPKLNQGIKIAEITVNDTTDSLYAPGGVSDVKVDGTSVVNQQGVAEIDLTNKQDNLTAGSNITITNNTISATDTTYNDFNGADGTSAGSQGLVPAPAATDNDKFLKGDGTWDAVSAGSSVIVTPTLSTGTKIADYSIDGVSGELYAPSGGSGTTVVANPTGTPTDELTSIQIGEDIYEIVGGGSGGNVELQKTVLLSTPITTTGIYTLADDYTNYDFIAIQAGNGSNEVDIHMYTSDEITTAMTNNLTITNPNTGGWFNFTMNADEITIPNMQISTINSVIGYKIIGGGSGSDAQIDTLFSANDYQENITLAHPYTDYDVLIINGVAPINNDSYQCSTTYITDEISINNNIGAYTDGSVIWYNVNDTTHLSCIGRQDVYITAIYGIKYGSGGGGGTNVIEKTQAQYDALTQAEKENGSIYMVKSTNTILKELTEPQIRTSTKVTASSYMVDSAHAQYHYPFGAFNRVSPTTWAYPEPGVTTETTWTPNVSEDSSNYSWIQYEFDAPVNMASMKIWAFTDYSSDTTKSFIIEGSNDGTTFTNILANGESSCDITATLNQNYENIIDLDNTNAYTYVRLRSLEPMGASYQPTMFIDEIFVYGYDTVSINKIYYMDTEYANTNNSEGGGGSSGGTNITTYETTITTSGYGWWNVTDENGAILDPSQYIIVDITCKMNGNIGPYYGCKWLYNTNYDGSNNKAYTMTLENINDGGFIRYSNTVTLQVSYTEIQ